MYTNINKREWYNNECYLCADVRCVDSNHDKSWLWHVSMATVNVHHYSKERHTLVLNCHPVDSTDTSAEVTLQLQDKEQALLWLKVGRYIQFQFCFYIHLLSRRELTGWLYVYMLLALSVCVCVCMYGHGCQQALKSEIIMASEAQQRHTDRALGALNGFLKERMFLRVSDEWRLTIFMILHLFCSMFYAILIFFLYLLIYLCCCVCCSLPTSTCVVLTLIHCTVLYWTEVSTSWRHGFVGKTNQRYVQKCPVECNAGRKKGDPRSLAFYDYVQLVVFLFDHCHCPSFIYEPNHTC